jgi:hypothetical protein
MIYLFFFCCFSIHIHKHIENRRHIYTDQVKKTVHNKHFSIRNCKNKEKKNLSKHRTKTD